MKKYLFKSATLLSDLIRTGEATSYDIVKEHLDHIKEHNHKLNALISVFEEEALKEARICDTEAGRGHFRGALHGVPVTIKEQFWIKGKHSNTNFKLLKDFVADEDAVVVDRIKKSGAIILGQTNVPRNLTDYQVSGDIYPEGKNPYNTEYSPGGSTGGGAAALAAGFTPLELGADFGGSVRVPANFCGVYGLKPTENTVPLHGNVPLPPDSNTFLVHMAQAGPLARSIEDIELLWNIIKGPHESDRSIPDINWKQPTTGNLSNYKIAWTDGWPGYKSSSRISNAIKLLADKIRQNGCQIEENIPDAELHTETLKVYMGLFPYVIAQGTGFFVRTIMEMQLKNGVLKGLKNTSPHLVEPLNQAFKMDANHYAAVRLQRSKITQRWESFFNRYDFLICPVAFGPAFKRCKPGSSLSYENKKMIYLNYVWPYVACFNASGHPTINIPLGLDEDGLPLGVQIVGKYWSEPSLLDVAKKIASLTQGFVKPNGF